MDGLYLGIKFVHALPLVMVHVDNDAVSSYSRGKMKAVES